MFLQPLRVVSLVTICCATQAIAQEDELLQEVVSWGRAIDLIGAADSASQGIVGYDDLSTRPILRVGELVEVVPGLIATQHSGGGKANQYFLRGMNLDHGTDFSIQFEGMPVNFRTHAHGQGYLDMNFIIPELVKTIEYRKGTHTADVGDFSAAASTRFDTYDRLDNGFAEVTIGTEEYQRLVAANSWDTNNGSWLGGLEIQYSDGPWENPENTERYNGMLKYSTDFGDYAAEFMATAYSNSWNATDQIPQRAVDDGTLDRFGFVDPSVGGKSHRYNLIANFTSETTYLQAFATSYGLNLFGNPTYFLNDPVNGDQIEQEDSRTIVGGRADRSWPIEWRDSPVEIRAGADVRYDMISKVNLFNTSLRQRLNTVRDDSVDEFSIGAYAEIEVFWTDKFRTIFGLRGDAFQWDVNSDIVENSGSGSESTVNPKFSMAWTPNEQWELYANYGTGFHSNDVRAAELTVDPITGEPAESFDVVVDATGFETGFRATLHERL
ncbi:MAG: TonB-dependent receptor, partial [Woeseiaceae bacterium]